MSDVGTVPDWRTLVAHQQPEWPDQARLRAVVDELAASPPVVTPWECDALTSRLAKVADGRAFLVQGGDCAERLDNVSARAIRSKLRLLQQMSVILSSGSALPVVTLGRIAGQYAKPRSSPTETVDGRTLPVYRGDAVNGTGFTSSERLPDPVRLRRVYDASQYTVDVVRASGAEVFTSHEGLLLSYEEALTRRRSGRRYAGSGHLLWIGDRTRQLDGAHVAYFASIENPVAVKLGPSTTSEDALALVDRLDPDRKPGRLTFVVRMGAERVRDLLPELVEKVAASGSPVVWMCDPMHGNTFVAPSGHKTRRFDDVLAEVTGFIEVHRALGTHPGGLHVEVTGEDVTECVGSGVGLDDLHRNYESACDPRLNAAQSLELAFLVADMLR
ncbi:3-deoxy-7-phosphoheptulonate synthase class II [Lentzea sp. NPDC051838]|uniref:3-deoxy-7-phosphoheptulonate synthase class II n=1 Tax=Lentzea sp. NPDC051838 TaxID=3154849 RepID=UPI00342054D7